MNISLILGHPHPGSLNHAIASTALRVLQQNGHSVHYHDLYAEGFNPILPYCEIPKAGVVDPAVARHCEELAQADGIVIVHPNWWGQPPAVLKGWIDRVIRPGVAYEFLEGDAGDGIPSGLLQARAALVFNTSNTPRARELASFGDPLEALWRNCIFDLCGVETVYRKMYGVVVTSSTAQREAWLDDVAGTVDRYFPASAGHSASAQQGA